MNLENNEQLFFIKKLFYATLIKKICFLAMVEESNGSILSETHVSNNSKTEVEGNRGTNGIHQITSSNKKNISVNENTDVEYIPRIRWPDTIVQIYLHLGCLYGLYLCIVSAKFYTTLFGKFIT